MRAGGRREIAGALVEGLVGKKSEGKGLLGVGGNAELRRRDDLDW